MKQKETGEKEGTTTTTVLSIASIRRLGSGGATSLKILQGI